LTEPRTLVERFFRHEFGRLGAVLTRFPAAPHSDLREADAWRQFTQVLVTTRLV
jgi:hypothetical protein